MCRRRQIGSCAVWLVALAVVGCGSSGPKGPGRTAKAVDSFADTKKHITNANKQVKATNDSLAKLTAAGAGGGDLRSLFNKYVDNVNKTEAMAKGAKARTDAMRKNTDAYVAEWQKEVSKITDEDLRKMSQDRAAAAKADFEKIRAAAAAAREAYDPYMQGLKDVQNYLTNDLTASGVQSIGAKANDTIAKGNVLQQRLTAAQAEVDTLSTQWSSKVGKSKK